MGRVTIPEVSDIRSRVLDPSGQVRPGYTTLPNAVIARMLEGFGDCATCPVLAEGIRLQLDKARKLELDLKGVGEWLLTG